MSELYASIDLGGTNLVAALADKDGNVVAQDKTPTESHRGPDVVLEHMAELIEKLVSKAGARPKALGIGVPGLVDLKKGSTVFLPNLPTKWRDVPVKERLEAKLKCGVFVLNDARMATLGELVFGRGKDVDDMVFLGLGTGVGGGVVIDNELYLGPMGAAGELGHLIVLPNGPACGCGNRGCLETLVSGPAITGEGVRLMLSGQAPKLHELTNGDTSKVNPLTIEKAALAGEKSVMRLVERTGEWLGIAITNLSVTLHPDLAVIGGGVGKMGELLLKPIRETVARSLHMMPPESIQIEQCLLGDKAGLMGGIALAQRGLPKTS